MLGLKQRIAVAAIVFFLVGSSPWICFAEKPYILSGFDDVLRQAENTNVFWAALKIFEKDKGFTGMPELYSSIAREEEEPNFVVVSAISHLFRGRVFQFLREEGFPSSRLYLRNWLTEWSIENFKVGTLEKIMNAKPGRRFIVILDNSDASLSLSNKIYQRLSTQVIAIYLRQVVAREIPKGASPFYTAFDIALSESSMDRLSLQDVRNIGEAMLREKEGARILPSFSVCPRNYNPCNRVNESLIEICQKVKRHILNICQSR